MTRNDTQPNTCIDQMTVAGVTVGLYEIWPAFGGGYIVTGSKNGTTERTKHETRQDAQAAFVARAELVNMIIDAQAYADEYADDRDTLATLLVY